MADRNIRRFGLLDQDSMNGDAAPSGAAQLGAA
jgi:hypothetical protein